MTRITVLLRRFETVSDLVYTFELDHVPITSEMAYLMHKLFPRWFVYGWKCERIV